MLVSGRQRRQLFGTIFGPFPNGCSQAGYRGGKSQSPGHYFFERRSQPTGAVEAAGVRLDAEVLREDQENHG